MKQTGRHFPLPKILLNLGVKGKSPWSFGWEIVRELACGAAPVA
jgi:hypothetical protein